MILTLYSAKSTAKKEKVKLLQSNVLMFAKWEKNENGFAKSFFAGWFESRRFCKENCKEDSAKLLQYNKFFFAIISFAYKFFGCVYFHVQF